MNIFEDMADRFEKRMRDALLNYGDDPEPCHAAMDLIMCETLEELGFDAGIKIFRHCEKWYS